MTMADVISAAAERFRMAGVEDPAGDAWVLANAANRRRGGIAVQLHGPVDGAASALLEEWVSQREARRPVSQIIGQRHFHQNLFTVTSDVLDPRPESEILVEEAIRLHPARILDLGTGSGCLLLSILVGLPAATGTGTDASHAALEVAWRNCARLGLQGRAEISWSDWCTGISGRFDLVVSNPPYLSAGEYEASPPELRRWEPKMALTEGDDGLSAYRSIAAGAGGLLRPGGRLLLEFGAGQLAMVVEIVTGCGWAVERILDDLDGRPRALVVMLDGPVQATA